MIDCKKISEEIKQELKQKLNNTSNKPKLAIIQVGDNEASNRYVKGKLADCEEVGIKTCLYKLPEQYNDDYIIQLIEALNKTSDIHGIIVQLPLPKHLDEQKIVQSIVPHKDVDGFTPNSPFTPCTPLGVLMLLHNMGFDDFKGRIITLVGFGKLVNKPLFQILSDMGATVCVCRSSTDKFTLSSLCSMSDIIISAVGKHGLLTAAYFNPGSIVIDCGIEVIDGKQYGDCSEAVYDLVELVTPRIGGVGLMTRAALMQNVVKAYLGVEQ